MKRPLFPRLRIEPGERSDYDSLASHHYRSGPPATFARILRAVLDASGTPDGREVLAGVLVVSMPTLNAGWRSMAWPDVLPPAPDRARAARAINAQVRTISRVVVDPRLRGLGIASALVRAYLRDPLTPCTEAVAAMARVSPIFSAAGMRRIVPPTSAADRAVRRAMRDAGVTPHRLLAGGRVPRRLAAPLSAWARASSGTRPFADLPLSLLARAAAMRLLAPPFVFVSP